VECFVAFLDILGMSKLVEPADDAPEKIEQIAETLRLIAQLRSSAVTWRTTIVETGEVKETTWETQIRTFSDCVAIFVPVASGRLNDLLNLSIFFHDSLLSKGFPVRGAITVGKMYWDQRWCVKLADATTASNPRITFGPGLVEAYELENKVAIYPRIIASPSLVKLLQENLEAPLDVQCYDPSVITQSVAEQLFTYGDIMKLLRSDFDGIVHVDVLSISSRIAHRRFRDETDKDNLSIHAVLEQDYLAAIREPIAGLQSSTKVPAVRAKLIWLAKYFNQSLDPEDGIEPIPVSWEGPDVSG
jgi:hypothetical protein